MVDLDNIADLLSPKFSGNESTTEIVSTIMDGDPDPDLSDDDIQYIAKKIRSKFPLAQRLPKLIANWGVAPKIGTRCYPQFLLVCGEDYSGALLDVKFELDDQLEHKASHTQPHPRKNPEDHWIFKFPFYLKTGDSDCVPGIYNMKLELKFAGLSDPLLPSHLFCDIRLTIPDADADAVERVLEIDSDDKSIVNLQGLNFRQFSKVKLKGSGSGLINLLQGQSDDAEDETGDSVEGDITQAYLLQVASKSEVNRLWQSTEITKRVCSKDASLRFPDGRNIVLLSQHRFEFGRSRESDIIVRFFPRSGDNDRKTGALSRIHCVTTIHEKGIEFQDKSKKGTELNYVSIKETSTLERGAFLSEIPFVMGEMLSAKQLELRLVPLVSEESYAVYEKERLRLVSFASASKIRWGKLWHVSNQLKLDAIRIERENNLSEEQYVVICQQATIGSSDIDCAIVVQGLPDIAARLLYIGRIFWLNKAAGDWDVSVDGHSLASNEMVPLSPEHEIEIDGIKMTFGAKAQLYL